MTISRILRSGWRFGTWSFSSTKLKSDPVRSADPRIPISRDDGQGGISIGPNCQRLFFSNLQISKLGGARS
jgi:hypothetical protein